MIKCPNCGKENISIVQVECMQHTNPHRFPPQSVVLEESGFEWWTHAGPHHDWSTTNEVAQCDDCGHKCHPGRLDEFGFGEKE